jgi:hypothetical protein
VGLAACSSSEARCDRPPDHLEVIRYAEVFRSQCGHFFHPHVACIVARFQRDGRQIPRDPDAKGLGRNRKQISFFDGRSVDVIPRFANIEGTVTGASPDSIYFRCRQCVFTDPCLFPGFAQRRFSRLFYKGATILGFGGSEYILAANFRSGKIDVFDSNFKPIRLPDERSQSWRSRSGSSLGLCRLRWQTRRARACPGQRGNPWCCH